MFSFLSIPGDLCWNFFWPWETVILYGIFSALHADFGTRSKIKEKENRSEKCYFIILNILITTSNN